MKTNTKLNRIFSILSLLTIISMGTASAHFTMVFPGEDMDVTPEDYIAEVGEKKTVWIIWGHPYEHILFDMTSIPEVNIINPKGTKTALTPTEITVGGKKAYKVEFTVNDLGDWIISVKYEDEDEVLIDYVKAIIHCGEEMWEGWDNKVGQNAEVMPYTRPYGLEETFMFTGKALYKGSPMKDAEVEIEMYHTKKVGDAVVEEAEEKYSYDPPMMFTRVTKSNSNGEFAYTLDEPGIWFIGAYGPEENGLTQRGIIIVPVLEAFPVKEEKSAVAPSDTKTIDEIKNTMKLLENKIDSMNSKVNSLDSEVKSVEFDVGAISASEPEPAKTPMLVYAILLIAVIAIILSAYAMMKK